MNISVFGEAYQSFYSRNLKWCRIFGDWILNGWIILNQNKMEDAKSPYLMRVLLGTPVYWLYFYP